MAYVRNSLPAGNYRKLDTITFDGSSVTYNITVGGASVSVGNVYQLLISIEGVIQNPGVAFSVSGSQITFAVAPAAYMSFFGILLGEKITTLRPADNSVSTASLQDSAVTTAKLNDGSVTAAKLASGAVPPATSAKVFAMMMA